GQLLERGQDPFGSGGRSGIDQHDAIRANLDADVSTRAGDHVEVLAHLDDVEPAVLRHSTSGQHAAQSQSQGDSERFLHRQLHLWTREVYLSHILIYVVV